MGQGLCFKYRLRIHHCAMWTFSKVYHSYISLFRVWMNRWEKKKWRLLHCQTLTLVRALFPCCPLFECPVMKTVFLILAVSETMLILTGRTGDPTSVGDSILCEVGLVIQIWRPGSNVVYNMNEMWNMWHVLPVKLAPGSQTVHIHISCIATHRQATKRDWTKSQVKP